MWAWFAAFYADSLERRGTGSPRVAALVTFGVIGVGAIGCWVGRVFG